MHTSIPPMFIIGSPRSGTTLLASMLEGSPWGTPFETHFIPKYISRALRTDLGERGSFAALAESILRERPIAQHRLSVNPAALYDALPMHTYASLVDAIGRACSAIHGAPSWGDKTPHYINHVGLLHLLFPRSRVIYIVRDGRDVAVSLLKKPWGPANVYGCALEWRHQNRAQPALDELRAAGLLHDLRYEHLLEDPVATLSALYGFLQLDVPADDIARRASTVRRDSTGGWMRHLTPPQIEVFEQVAGQTLARLGYRPTRSAGRVGLPQRIAFGLQNRYKHASNLFVMNVIETVRIRCFGMEPFAQ